MNELEQVQRMGEVQVDPFFEADVERYTPELSL